MHLYTCECVYVYTHTYMRTYVHTCIHRNDCSGLPWPGDPTQACPGRSPGSHLHRRGAEDPELPLRGALGFCRDSVGPGSCMDPLETRGILGNVNFENPCVHVETRLTTTDVKSRGDRLWRDVERT